MGAPSAWSQRDGSVRVDPEGQEPRLGSALRHGVALAQGAVVPWIPHWRSLAKGDEVMSKASQVAVCQDEAESPCQLGKTEDITLAIPLGEESRSTARTGPPFVDVNFCFLMGSCKSSRTFLFPDPASCCPAWPRVAATHPVGEISIPLTPRRCCRSSFCPAHRWV